MSSIQTPDWVKDSVFYQIFPERFAKSTRVHKPPHLQEWGSTPTIHGFQGGDLLGVIEKLDYLKQLGINAIFFNPVFASASNHRYHTYDYFQVDPLLGGNQALFELLDEAHKRGIRVILDGVFNHASRGFFQFNHLMECGHESPYRDWFHVHHWPINAFDQQSRPNYEAWWGMPALPKLNTNNPEVREFLWRVGTYWLEQGIDGWRLDVPNEINDDEFWREFRRRCLAVNPECYIVGEIWHDAHRWLQGDQFDAVMNYVFTRAAFGFFVGENMDQSDTHRMGYGHIATLDGYAFGRELDRFLNHLYHPQIVQAQMNMLGSHDTPRLATIARNDKAALRMMFLCLMTTPGAPNIYYGDEIGMLGAHDPLCRYAFPWNDETQWDKALFADLQRYIALRHATPCLRRGNFHLLHSLHHTVAYSRSYQGQTALVAFNNSHEAQTFVLHHWPEGASHLTEQLTHDHHVLSADSPIITLPPRTGRVWLS